MVRRKTQGSPVAAGVIAFGGGLLVGTLLPESAGERRTRNDSSQLWPT